MINITPLIEVYPPTNVKSPIIILGKGAETTEGLCATLLSWYNNLWDQVCAFKDKKEVRDAIAT